MKKILTFLVILFAFFAWGQSSEADLAENLFSSMAVEPYECLEPEQPVPDALFVCGIYTSGLTDFQNEVDLAMNDFEDWLPATDWRINANGLVNRGYMNPVTGRLLLISFNADFEEVILGFFEPPN